MTLLPEIRDELYATAARRTTASRGGRAIRSLRSPGLPSMGLARRAAGPTLAVAVVVAVAVVSLGGLGRRDAVRVRTGPAHPAAAPAGTGRSRGTADRSNGVQSVSAGVRGLIAELAVLRRPQTPADRSLTRFSPPAAGPQTLGIASLARLARVVRTPEGVARIYLQVVRLSRPTSFSGGRARVMVEGEVVGPGSSELPLGGAASFSLHSPLQVGAIDGTQLAAAIVPDGVAAATWVFQPPSSPRRPVAIRASIAHNIAVARNVPARGWLTSAVWFAADGHVIASLPVGRRSLG